MTPANRELIYHALKALELAAFNAVNAMPGTDGEAFAALGIEDDEGAWRWDAIVEHLLWVEQKAKQAAEKYAPVMPKEPKQ